MAHKAFSRFFCIIIGLTAGTSAFAKSKFLEIESVQGSKAVLVTPQDVVIEEGEFLTLSKKCVLRVIRRDSSKVLVATDQCSEKQLIRKGQKVPVDSPNPQPEFSEASEKLEVKDSEGVPPKPLPSQRIWFLGVNKDFLRRHVDSRARYPYLAPPVDIRNNSTISFKQIVGLNFGRLVVRPSKFGYLTLLDLGLYDPPTGPDFQGLRLELNGTLGIGHWFYLYAGINGEQYIGNKEYSKIKTALGSQIGLGLPLGSSGGLRIQYIHVEHSIERNLMDVGGNFYNLRENYQTYGLTLSFQYSLGALGNMF